MLSLKSIAWEILELFGRESWSLCAVLVCEARQAWMLHAIDERAKGG